MNILHVISGLPEAAGTTLFCVEVCDRLTAHGLPCGVVARAWRQAVRHPRLAALESIPRGTGLYGRWCETRSLTACLQEQSARGPTLVHVHALWDPFVHTACRVARRRRLPLVVSPHGMVTPWALRHRAAKKQLAWRLYQRADLASAAVLHVTAAAEAEDLRALGFRQPLAVVPLGVDLPDRQPASISGKKTILFLSRIHPKKGLLNLVEAWAQVRPSDWQVVIAGPDEQGHQIEIERLAEKRGVRADFRFPGPVFGREKDRLYREARLFVLPSYSENFGVVVPEALAYGVPVITTRATPWEELQTHRCGWWIDTGVEPLAEALRQALALPDDERQAMGRRGRALVGARYSWESVAQQMAQVYLWIEQGGQAPACVRLD